MNINYLSENIIIENNHSYFIDNKTKIKINKYNWHKYFDSLGWFKFDISIIKQINKLSKNPCKNNLFGLLDCGGGGDCLFNCISHAYNSSNVYDIVTSMDLRNKIAESINERNFEDIIEHYKIMHTSNEFSEDWDPYNINLRVFKNKIKDSSFWSDYILINKLINILNINLIILTEHNNRLQLYNTLHKYNENIPSIIIYYIDHHFLLVGYFNDTIVSLFNDSNLPYEIKQLFK